MKLLFENWRKYTQTLLNEISLEQAKEQSLYGKATDKMLKGYLYGVGLGSSTAEEKQDFFQNLKDGDKTTVKAYNVLLDDLREKLLSLIADDIPEDNQKGQALLWIIRFAKKNQEFVHVIMNSGYLQRSEIVQLKKNLEVFFQQQRFMSEPDLNKIQSPEQLADVVEAAKPAIEAYQEKQAYMDVEEGMEVFRNDSKWLITAIHNKGAACELGKGTDWCTAAPGLDYFEQYYDQDDPLFFFKDKKTGERFQFHYGSAQFMDEQDIPLADEFMAELHNLLKRTSALNKYKVIRTYDDSIIAGKSTDPEELEELAERYAKDITETGLAIKRELMHNKNATEKLFRIIFEKESPLTGATQQNLALKAKDHDILTWLVDPKNQTFKDPRSLEFGGSERQGKRRAAVNFRNVLSRVVKNPTITQEIIDKILNLPDTQELELFGKDGVVQHVLPLAVAKMIQNELDRDKGHTDFTPIQNPWVGLTKKQLLKITDIVARKTWGGHAGSIFRDIMHIAGGTYDRSKYDKDLINKILEIGVESRDKDILGIIAGSEEASVEILEKITNKKDVPLAVLASLVSNPNTSEDMLNKIIDADAGTLILQSIFERGGKYSPAGAKKVSEKLALRLLLLHQERPNMSISSADRLVRRAAEFLRKHYDYSTEDIGKLLGEEYKKANKEALPYVFGPGGTRTPKGDDWADYLPSYLQEH